MLLLPARRIFPRFPFQKIISYSHQGKKYLTLTENLGLGGMRIKTHYYLPRGELLDFTLFLGDTSHSLKGRTVYSRSLPGNRTVSGIQFVRLSERDRLLLRSYLAKSKEWPRKGMHSTGERSVSRSNWDAVESQDNLGNVIDE